jgi:hypothetical protein
VSRYWYKPDYWLWWWRSRASLEFKAICAVIFAALLLAGGFETTRFISPANAATPTTYVTTLHETRVVTKPITVNRVVTVVHTTAAPGNAHAVTHFSSTTRTVTVTVPVVSHAYVTVTKPVTSTQIETAAAAPVTATPVTSTLVETQTATVTTPAAPVTVTTAAAPVTVTQTNTQMTTVIKTVTKSGP